MKESNEKKVNNKKVESILSNETLSKSSKMKELYNLNVPIKEIAVLMNVRYNFVYNVVSNYCNMNNIELSTNKKEGKKEKIITMFLEGKSNKEISIELQTNYNYVFNVIKKYKNENQVDNEKEVK